jgi:hypothetical protein
MTLPGNITLSITTYSTTYIYIVTHINWDNWCTPFMVLSVAYHLELRKAITSRYIDFRLLLTKIE